MEEAKELIDEFPEPSPIADQPEPESPQYPDGFDPSIHLMKDGQPVRNKDGSFRLRRGAAKKSVQSSLVTPGTDSTPSPDAPQTADYEALGAVAANTLTTLCVGVFGEEWQANRSEERNLKSAFAAYFATKQVTDIPPGLALSLAIGAYAVPRVYQPKTRSKLGRVKDWVVKTYKKWRTS